MATVKKVEEGKKLAKATPADTVAKVEAVKKAAAKEAEAAKKAAAPKAEAKPAAKKAAAPKTEAKPAAKKAAAPKAEAKKPAAKKAAAPKAEAKKPAAKKPAAKKPAAKAGESVFIEFAGGQIEVASLIEKAKANVGKKTVKELNVYYQPETGMVYYTADGEAGSYKL